MKDGPPSPVRRGRTLLLVPAWKGQETRDELERQIAQGIRPRSDYLELARALDADVTDMEYMTNRAALPARALARRGSLVPAQILDAFLRGRHYAHVLARADRLGLPLALMYKLTRGRRDLVLISAWLSRPKKAVFLSRFRAHSHLALIINYSSVQRDIAARLGVPEERLRVFLQPVDEVFWRPAGEATERRIVAVGSEARDYPTLVRAIQGLDVVADVAVGSSVLRSSGSADALFGPIIREAVSTGASASVSSQVRVHQQLRHHELRDLYARARFVVIPLQDVDTDAGVTAIAEAMAMGKAVVVTRTQGQIDVVRHGETGLYVPPGDPDALRAAIRRLLDDPVEADRMGRAGRALVEAQHRLDGWVSAVAAAVTGDPQAARLRSL